MAALSNGPVPVVKLEDGLIKDEPMEDEAVPYMDDGEDEGGDLDFSGAKREVWLGHVPRTLWGVLSKLGTTDNDDEEIEIGTIRVEGPEARPQRVSLLLNATVPQFSMQHKEYNLFETRPSERRAKRKGRTLIFSEQDVAGYQPRKFNFNDVDEQGNPVQANSKLFEKWKRSQNNKKRRAERDAGVEDVPQQRRKMPKKTAIQGVIGREFDVKPVKNADYVAIEAAQTGSMLHQKKKQEAVLIKSLDHVIQIEGTADQLKQNRDAVKRRLMREREDRKANQYQRLERPALQSLLHQLFARHKVWPFKELRLETKQPVDYLKSVLEEIAFQPAKGDWAGKWVMKEEYRNTHLADLQDLYVGEQAPETNRSDADIADDDELDDEEEEDEEEDIEFLDAV